MLDLNLIAKIFSDLDLIRYISYISIYYKTTQYDFRTDIQINEEDTEDDNY